MIFVFQFTDLKTPEMRGIPLHQIALDAFGVPLPHTCGTISELVKQLNPRRSAVCAATAAAVKILKIAKLGTKMSSFRSTCLSINLMLLTISLVEAEVHHICFLHLKPELKNKSLHLSMPSDCFRFLLHPC